MAGTAIGILAYAGTDMDSIVIILTMLGFGLIGFLDDFEKIAKKNNLGLNPKQKVVLQLIFGGDYSPVHDVQGRSRHIGVHSFCEGLGEPGISVYTVRNFRGNCNVEQRQPDRRT